MAFLINPARWRVKPGPDVELDFRHPLTEGLVGCWVVNERSGDTIVDHAPAGNHGPIVGDSVTRGLALPGPVLAMTGDNNNHQLDLGSVAAGNPLMLDGDHVTWMWDTTLTGFQNNAPRIIDKSTGGVAANGWALYPVNTGSVVWAAAINGSEYRLDPPGHSTGTRTRGAITKEGTTRIVLRDPNQGAPYIEETSGNVPIPTATANAAIGNWNHATDRNWTGWISHVYVWSRVLSAHEIAYMRAKPYAMFKPRARRKLYLPSTFATAPTGEGQGIVVIAIAS